MKPSKKVEEEPDSDESVSELSDTGSEEEQEDDEPQAQAGSSKASTARGVKRSNPFFKSGKF